MTRLILTGGGTGGHIYPALAIAEGVRRRWPDAEILYVGAKNGMESRIVTDAGYPFRGITAEGWQGRKIFSLTGALRADYKGSREAADIYAEWQPQALIGTGGYVCLPAALAAYRKRIPIYIHEQNAFPGMTNRLVSYWARRVMLSFEEAADRFPASCRKRTALTGLPVRESLAGASKSEAAAFFQLHEGRKTILATGGSQGAERINRAMVEAIGSFAGRQDVQVVFATGRRDFPKIREELAALGICGEDNNKEAGNVRVYPYIDRMDLAYAAADLYVGRAGASTLAEITLCRLPAILIPYPHASENHQTYNASSLADQGGAVLLEDRTLSGPALAKALEGLLDDDGRRLAMAECSGKAAFGRALEDILDIVAEVMGDERKGSASG